MTIADILRTGILVDTKVRINKWNEVDDLRTVFVSNGTTTDMDNAEIDSIGDDVLCREVTAISVGSGCVLNIEYQDGDEE